MNATNTVLNPNHYGEDGVDHISIRTNGKTTIGRHLSQSWNKKFTHPALGNFDSIECMKNWILDEHHDDDLRISRPRQKGRQQHEQPRTPNRWIPNVTENLLSAGVAAKILQDNILVNDLVRNELPLLCYNVMRNSGLRVTVHQNSWFFQGLDDAMYCIQNNVTVEERYAELGLDLTKLGFALFGKTPPEKKEKEMTEPFDDQIEGTVQDEFIEHTISKNGPDENIKS